MTGAFAHDFIEKQRRQSGADGRQHKGPPIGAIGPQIAQNGDERLVQRYRRHAAADANDDGAANTADVIYLLRYLYVEGSAPPYPAESGLHGMPTLVNNTETDEMLKIRVMNISKKDLSKTLKKFKGAAWDQSPIFKKLYEEEYGQLGGEPYGCLVGDYHFDHSPPDVELLGEPQGARHPVARGLEVGALADLVATHGP